MTKKYLRVTMPDGSRWDVPCEIIAKSRASYYAKLDSERGDGTYDDLYATEYEFTLGDEPELVDWAANNMNWSAVKEHARRVEDPPKEVDWQDGWTNGDKEVVERPCA